MEELLLLSIGFGVGLSGAIAPGPLFTATIKDTLKYGPLTGPMMCIGHLFVEISIILGLALGVSYVINIPIVRALIGVVGGIGLLYLGYQMIKERKKFESISEESIKNIGANTRELKNDLLPPIKTGFVFTILNPAMFIWWFTIGNSLIMRGLAIGFMGVFMLFIGHWFADVSWYTFLSVSLSKGKKFISKKVYEVILLACGIFLLYLGITFLYESIPYFSNYI
ncbi:MAG: LysE type translocator [Euryarchaeota archaeon ADurb.Bin023]|jgi:threonine/homoserine/homoserine lactone efflux protein|nr:LysE family transporter [Methanofastidiosum sp.]OQC50577.1 MAG: LysE type translocator [Euryarchaeota archaeon ADurb.Bin023]HNV93705.1 LysE family transporter [Methanofastidiosum sp.]HNZ60852.1 LysE family transporter [Methanofastidiosum sp.]HOE93321.1 LysE family transporter [Methanofastidiosum sp.]